MGIGPKWNKKMAEAFGRAVYGKNDKESSVTKSARQTYQRDLDNYTKDVDAKERAEAFNRGNEKARLDKQLDDMPEHRESSIDDMRDIESDGALKKDFEDAFDDVAERHGYERWRKDVGKQQLDDRMDGEIHNLEREGAVDDVRAEMIEDLKNHMDFSDFFDKWKR